MVRLPDTLFEEYRSLDREIGGVQEFTAVRMIVVIDICDLNYQAAQMSSSTGTDHRIIPRFWINRNFFDLIGKDRTTKIQVSSLFNVRSSLSHE